MPKDISISGFYPDDLNPAVTGSGSKRRKIIAFEDIITIGTFNDYFIPVVKKWPLPEDPGNVLTSLRCDGKDDPTHL